MEARSLADALYDELGAGDYLAMWPVGTVAAFQGDRERAREMMVALEEMGGGRIDP